MEELKDLSVFHNDNWYGVEDIADSLMREAQYVEEETKRQLITALDDLRDIADNPYNFDYWRVLYNTLVRIAGYN